MPAITINQLPAKVFREIKIMAGNRSGYARKALANQLARDGRDDLAKLLQKPASNRHLHPKPNDTMKTSSLALRPGTKRVPGHV